MLTDDGARAAAAADTVGEEYQGDYYTYTGGAGANAAGANAAGANTAGANPTGANAAGVIRPAPGRPLPPVPVPGGATGAPGQSGHAEAEMDRMVNGVRALQLGESQGTQVESFLLRQLGYFKGDYNGEAITEWTDRVELLKDMLKAKDEEILRIIPLRMSSRAAQFLKGFLSTKDRKDHTWDTAKNALLIQFGGKVEPTQLLNQLQEARMGRNTPVREFALQVGRLARLAYPELSSDNGTPEQKILQRTMFNRIALEQFTAGLPPLLSRPILEHSVTDFEKAVDLAAHHEQINARYMRKTTIHAMQYEQDALPQTRTSDDSGVNRESGDRPIHRNQGRGRPSQRGSPYNRKRPVVCFRCHKPGHVKRECHVALSCQICGESGHLMERCLNIVCAACKGTGHPANKCPKNLQSRDQTRLNTNF